MSAINLLTVIIDSSMVALRITPRVVFSCLALSIGAWLAVHLPWALGWGPHRWTAERIIKTIFPGLAYTIALALNLGIAAEYKRTRWVRLAWTAMAANAGASILRIIIESPLVNIINDGDGGGPLPGLLLHLTVVPANIFLLIGLAAMWWAYSHAGLGFTAERRDYVAIGGVLLLTGGLTFFREGLSESNSPYPVSRYLQLIGLVLLSLSAIAGLALRRMAMQMGGGRLATAIFFLTLYALAPIALVLFQALDRLDFVAFFLSSQTLNIAIEMGWQTVPWIVTVAAAYRTELIVHDAEFDD